MTPQVRTGLTHVGTALGGAIAAVGFMSSHSVDIYAIWDQLNVVIASVTKFIALVTPIATGAYGVYKATTKQKLIDIAADPKAAQAAAEIPPTKNVVAVADALKKATIILFAVGLALSLFGSTQAYAQKAPQVTGNLFKDIAANNANGVTPGQGIEASVSKLKDVSLVDIQYAKALADAIGTPRSKIRSTCYGAWIKVIQQSQGLTAGEGGKPLGPLPDPSLFSHFEQSVEVIDNLQPDSEFMVACQPAATLLKQSIFQFIATAVGGVATAGALGIP